VEHLGVMHWLQRRANGDGTSQPRAMSHLGPMGQGVTVEVVGAQGARVVQMETNGRRVSDLVNQGDELSVTGAPGPHQRSEATIESLDLDDALILVPPPQAGDPRHRLHRPGHPVRIVVGPYEIVGDAHTPPGTQAVGFLVRVWPRFVPLTSARVRLAANPEFSWRVPVAIVNLAKADLLRDAVVGDA